MKKIFLGIVPAVFFAAPLFAGEMANTICPVMTDHKADAAKTLDYQGKTYGFCCKKCISKFRANPEKYLARMAKQECTGDLCS